MVVDEKFKKLFGEFKKLNLPDGKYAVYGSGPMAVRGIKPVNDLDIIVTDDLYQELLEKYPENEKGCIAIGDIEIYSANTALIDNPKAVIARAELIKGVRFVRLDDLIVWKKKMARSKDFEHIKMIKDYLNGNLKKTVSAGGIVRKIIDGKIHIVLTRDSEEHDWVLPKGHVEEGESIEQAVIRQLYKGISIYDRSGIFLEFEQLFAQYYRRRYALLCNSGTSAIHSMFVAAGLKENDEVICPAYTFFATVTPLFFLGAKPVLCDCNENGNIDPEAIKKSITRKTKAIIITHMWGVPCNMDEIVRICKDSNLILMEDCSHAHGARYREKVVGSFGDLASWSLQGPKNITGGEGGILVTDNKEFYYRALLLGHYNKRCKQEIPKKHNLYKYSVTGMGLKYRAHPLAVAIAYELFREIDTYLKIKRKFAKIMIKELKNLPGIFLPPAFFKSYIKPSWYGFVFQYNAAELQHLPIEKYFEALWAEGLMELDRPGSTSPLNFFPLFQNPGELFPIYKKHSFSYKVGDFPMAERFYQNAIKLPMWASKKDTKFVNLYIAGIKKVINYYRDLL